MYLKMKTYPFTKNFCRRDSLGKDNFENKLAQLRRAFNDAEYVVIGAGAGLSTAAGIAYEGKRFTDNFQDFINRYGVTDMYTATFYPFQTEEERWAYWARHIRLNRYGSATELYRLLHDTVKEKDHFVITTNVDGQFEKAGFNRERIFAVQGDYAYLQCAEGCHDRLYYNESLVNKMCQQTEECHIPTELVPHCPVCGGRMEVHVRKDRYFVQDNQWYASYQRYQDFMEKAFAGNTFLLELGVGYNTPTIIRFPFERMAMQKRNITLVRINKDYPDAQTDIPRFLPFDEDIRLILTHINNSGSLI